MVRSLTGTRIREIRRRAKISQVSLAKEVGISASYLNLIEHNRRSIGGQILNAIAAALDVRSSDLADGQDATLLSDLRESAGAESAALEPVEELAARFPGWAAQAARQARKIRDQQIVIRELSDRLNQDPFLEESVHGILSGITAIRSTASILAQVEGIEGAQVDRFHKSLHAESLRLSDTSKALADYLSNAGSEAEGAATAEEAVEQFLGRHSFAFEGLDREAEMLRVFPREVALKRLGGLVSDILDDDQNLAGAARDLAHENLQTYAEDALDMPLDAFAKAAEDLKYDPLALAAKFGRDLHAVFRRMSQLRRPNIDAPRFGMITVNASGYPRFRHVLPGFALPRHGNACPLWPLFQAFAQPGQALRADIRHDSGLGFAVIAFASPREARSLGGATDLIASMLIIAAEASPFAPIALPPKDVGTTCRICSHAACPARNAPQLIQG